MYLDRAFKYALAAPLQRTILIQITAEDADQNSILDPAKAPAPVVEDPKFYENGQLVQDLGHWIVVHVKCKRDSVNL